MHINFTGHGMELTPALKTFAQEKFDKLVKHFNKITTINVVFEVEKLRQIAEATIFVNKSEIHASSESQDMYNAIDLLIEKLDKQLVKYKEKRENHRD